MFTHSLFTASLLAPAGSFDVVVMCGGLSVDLVAVSVVRELCNACTSGKILWWALESALYEKSW